MSNTYKCAACGGVFAKSWSDEEAMQESKEMWGEWDPADLCIVCDDCFNRGEDDAQTQLLAGLDTLAKPVK